MLLLLAACAFPVSEAAPVAAAPDGAAASEGPADYVAHEWGTFTTVAKPDGTPLVWRPLIRREDLPHFVYRAEEWVKGRPSVVRMETPVIYFYTPTPCTVSVDVRFPGGGFSEWFPQATLERERLSWPSVHLGPDDAPLPEDGRESHYYPARRVPSAQVRVGEEVERFLFYRGVADFQPAVSFRLDGDTVRAARDPGRPWLLYRREGERVGFTLVDGHADARLPKLASKPWYAEVVLRELLTGAGLYPEEAEAMVATWQGDWFADGLRAIYLYTPAETDAVLPLTLTPRPRETVRVLVGRTELFGPAALAEARALVSNVDDAAAIAALAGRFGRFAGAVLRLAMEGASEAERARLSGLIGALEGGHGGGVEGG